MVTRDVGALDGIMLEYRLDEQVSLLTEPTSRPVERWTVTVRTDDSPAAQRDIGYAQLIILNLENGLTPADLADEATGDWVVGVTTECPGPPDEPSALILDRLWIDPEWRGNGLGPIVAACAILRLGRGCRLAACFPAPFEPGQRDDERSHSVAALGRIWAKVGFAPWTDGVWMLDLQSDTLRDALARLLPHYLRAEVRT